MIKKVNKKGSKGEQRTITYGRATWTAQGKKYYEVQFINIYIILQKFFSKRTMQKTYLTRKQTFYQLFI